MNLKKKTMTALFLILVTLGASAFAYSQDWPMYGQNPQNTGYSPSSGPSTGDLQWVYPIKSFVLSSPAVADGKLYIGATDGKLYCLDAYTGAWIWEYDTESYIDSSPTVVDGEVYICSENGIVYCLNADTGDGIWDTPIGEGLSSPVVAEWPTVDPFNPPAADELVVICSENGNVYFLNADNGVIEWIEVQISPVEPIYASPIVADGMVYYALYESEVRALALGGWGGKVIYRPDGVPDCPVVSSPAIADGKLYVGSENHWVYCFDVDQHVEIWNFQTGHDIISSPAVADGEVYICSEDGQVYCLDAYTGALIWQYTAGTAITSSLTVADNKVYIGGVDGKLYCLNADSGAWIWDYFIEDDLNSPVVADGRVYITSYSGNVYCIGSTLEERIASLEAENEALKTENAALRSDLDALNARVSETEIKFMELPGKKLDIYIQGEYTISAEDTTHIWHYHISDLDRGWSEYSVKEKAEFLSTAQVHIYVNGEEISLTHVLRYREDRDRMWSIYYRVFPPGYWEINRNNKLVGEWIHVDKDGDWVIETHTATLRVK